MRLYEITEAPVIDYQTIGDFENPIDKPGKPTSHFDEVDLKFLIDPKRIDEVFKVFQKLPYNLRLYFLNLPDDPPSPLPQVAFKELHRLALTKRIPGFKEDPNSITMIYVGNFTGSPRMPMTAWMIGHRMTHAIDVAVYKGRHIMDEIPFGEFFNEINEKVYNGKMYKGDLAKIVGTTKAFRSKGRSPVFELWSEHFVQYMITGNVKFNDLPTKRPDNTYAGSAEFTIIPEQYKKYNDLLHGQFKQDLIKSYDKDLSNVVGKILSF